MKKSNSLSRAHLETLSSSELINLADEYGIDIPDDLDRQFIIGDLLELSEEFENNAKRKEIFVFSEPGAEGEVMNIDTLPESYNETKINVLLRNPVSLFVWWDLNETVCKNLKAQHGTLYLSVYFFIDDDEEKPCDTFSIQINAEDHGQYVIIPAGKKYVRVDLVEDCAGKADTLSISPKIRLPEGGSLISSKPGEMLEMPNIMELSGAAEALSRHYNEYRQSFFKV